MAVTTAHPDRTCIIGAGLAGLAAAWDLGRAGRDVILLEGSHEPGGLASSVMVAGRPVERFYHFICRGDSDLLGLVDELGLGHFLHWRNTVTSYLYQGEMYRFGSSVDLLHFRPVPWRERLRFGLNVAASRYRRRWRQLDQVSACEWLRGEVGDRAYEVIWDPLLRVKFGPAHDQVSAAWIWHRMNRVARSRRFLWERERLGYLELGSATVVDELLRRLRAMGNVELRTGVTVEQVVVEEGGPHGIRVAGIRVGGSQDLLPCRHVLSTVALPALVRLAPALPAAYRSRLASVGYLGVVCGLLRLDRPLSSSFWVNISDRRTPYNGVIEYSNLNRHLGLGRGAIVYVPYYLDAAHERFGYDDRTLLAEYETCLRCVNPSFGPSWVQEVHISRARYAQAICTVGFADQVPDHRSPLAGLYLTDSTQFYPEDRTLSAAIRLGRRVVRMILGEGERG